MRRLALLLLLPAGTLAAQTAVHIDPTWLKADSAAAKVEVTLVAGLTGANGGMNFDGATAGGLTLTVPAKWTVVLHFANNDQVLPHSVMVVPATTPVPVTVAAPAFAHAVTHRSDQGLAADTREDVQFVADRPGSYLLFCAVPGHGAAGMWIHFDVSGTAHQPELVATPKAQ
ncbi:MAG TPA: sulfocyanin-like copper-binding protein [Gemmatimonadales bacterium]|nr:sulfocyanin-like copper-binding protein [Gemmatimonadales bacterium]